MAGSSGGLAYEKMVASDMAAMGQRIDKLVLMCEAMWTLLSEHTSLTEADLARRVTELDLRDGKEDGKTDRPAERCPKCGSGMSKQFGRCLFCGEAYTPNSIFETL